MPGATDPVDQQDEEHERPEDEQDRDDQDRDDTGPDEQPPDAEGRPDLEWEQVPDLDDVHQDADDDLGEGAD